jgi:hypothetical protein
LLLRTILPLLDDMYAVICRVATRFESSADDHPARLEVADLAALAGMALQERRSRLTHPQPCHPAGDGIARNLAQRQAGEFVARTAVHLARARVHVEHDLAFRRETIAGSCISSSASVPTIFHAPG